MGERFEGTEFVKVGVGDGISYTASFRAWIVQFLRLVRVVPRYLCSGYWIWGYSSFKMIAILLRRY
jgi:hypothetical protein